ncbi:MAG TPA: hypothetical protein VK543_12800 [Puia sp.]|nr:hypothetical protein [Puia sp.]
MRLILAQLLLFVLLVQDVAGQDTLPKFSAVMKANGKIIISWHNIYSTVNQISIQRSKDSLKNFTTVLTVPDPTIPENGFVDSKSAGPDMYYRLFILLENSKYTFSKSKRAIPEAIAPASKMEQAEEESNIQKVANQRIFDFTDNGNRQKPRIVLPNKISEPPPIEVEKTIFIKQNDSVIGELPGNMVRRFRDSILNKTKDTLLFVHADTILIKPFVAKEVYKISVYVFAAKDGNVNISLPDAARKKYAIRFFEQDNAPLFEVKDIKDPQLVLDKANFVHAGWFRFELYEDGRLKEKNRLFIPKDF